MSERLLPRYPIYIPSKGRFDNCFTAQFLVEDKVPFKLVVEPQEFDSYATRFGKENVLTLPFSNLGQGSIPARNWIKEHSTKEGHLRHWQLDDNIKKVWRWYKGKRLPSDSGPAFRCVEDFSDRYENVAISGMNYVMFAIYNQPAFHLNCRVYSCSLVLNSIPHKWRGRYNEDTDICLQVLADNWCTILVNAFLIEKMRTMTMKGGNSAQLYQGDGRLKMARSLERIWPHVVGIHRRFKRPQHIVRNFWQKFDTPLKMKEGLKLEDFKKNEYGLKLKEVKDVKSKYLKELVKDNKERNK